MPLDRKMSLSIDKDILGKTKAEPLSIVTRNYSIAKVLPKHNQIIQWRTDGLGYNIETKQLKAIRPPAGRKGTFDRAKSVKSAFALLSTKVTKLCAVSGADLINEKEVCIWRGQSAA